MNASESNLLASDFDWLPSRYQFKELLARNNFNYFAVLALDLSSYSEVFLELVPVNHFDSDGLFRLEHYFGFASRLKHDSLIAPTDHGTVTDQTGQEYVLLARPHANGTTLEELLAQRETSDDKAWNNMLPTALPTQIAWMKELLIAIEQFHTLGIAQQEFRLCQLLVDGGAPHLISPDLRFFSKPEYRDEEWSRAFIKSASPELMGLIEQDVNDRSDIYSAGVIFYCLLVGELPFDGETMSQILSAHMTKQIDSSTLRRSPLMKVVARMLEKAPHDRYQSVSSIVEDLDWLLDNKKLKIDEFVPGRTEVRNSITVPMFVGREKERTQIRMVIDDVRDGANRTILIEGESGIGKTWLIRESLREASQAGIQVFHSEAREKAGGDPVEPLTSLIQNLVQSDLNESIAQRLDEVHAEVHYFFPEFAESIGLKEPARPRGIDTPDDEKTELFELNRLSLTICNVLASLASPHQPAIIWIDDCQWLDSATRETLRKLERWEKQSLLIILSARKPEDESVAKHSEIEFDEKLELGPLEDQALTELVDSMAIALPKRAVETIVRLSSGSPVMAESLLHKLVEDGAIVFQDAQWTINEERLEEAETTSDATEALLRRLEKFPPEVLEPLSIAALIGKSFFSSTVSAINGTSPQETQTHLAWARRHRLIWSRPDGSQAFVHDGIRKALIEQLPQLRRNELHVCLAEHFEANEGDPIEIALHFDKAAQPQLALAPALEAARRAQETSSISTEVQMYRIAWNGIPRKDNKLRSQIAERMANALMYSGEYDESDLWFRRSANNTDSNFYGARIVMQRGELAFKRGDKKDAVELLEEAMKLLRISIPKSWLMVRLYLAWELTVQLLHSVFPSMFLHRKSMPSKKDRMVWKTYSRLSHCYWYTQGKAIVLWAHLAGMNRAETATPTRELAQAWSDHAPVMGLIPWFSRGASYAARSLSVRHSLKDIWGEGQTRNYFSVLLYGTSRFQKSIAEAKKAESLLTRAGDYWELNIARYQRAASLYRLGKLKESYDLAMQTRQDALKVGDHQSAGNILDILSRASLGKIPFEYIEMEKNRELVDLQFQPRILLAEGVYNLGNENDPAIAISCFEKALETIRKTGVSNSHMSPNAAWLATALRRKIAADRKSGTVSAASFKQHFVAAKRAVRLAERFQNDLPHALRELGFAWADKGNQVKARESLLRSLKLAQSQEALYEAALTRQAFEKMDVRFGWREVNEENQTGNHEVCEIEATVRLNAPRETVSIVNRFDALLDAGRKISSALGRREILKHTVESTADLLRGQTTLIVLPDEENSGQWNVWNSEDRFDQQIVLDAVNEREPIVRDREMIEPERRPEGRTASVLCCPVVAGKDVVACIYVSNRLVESMFGSNEVRIAEFIGNAAGSSLEKETTFRELDDLNAHLEQNVVQRTRSLQTRTRELESTAQQLLATQTRLELAAEAAESANQTKSDFLAKMSHEIRTPITAVLGFTQLILRGVVSEPDEQRKKIKSIESSGKHLLQLVNDLLDISKIEAEKIEIDSIECRPLNLLNEIVESVRSQAEENNNELKLDLVAPLPESIQSDPKRLRQVVTNILGNAIKFTSDGTITLKASFEDKEGRGVLNFDVIDTGIGMTPDQLENVFDPFVQADSSITRRFGGTGLGLSISQKLTKALGGEIKVESTLGEGSTFSITIDAGDPAQLRLMNSDDIDSFFEQHVASDWVTADLSGLQILLADDAQTNRDLISLVLGDCGAEITLAGNGKEAVEHALGENSFDIVLMDMQMPILDGYSATRKLRSKGYQGPIYALTANSMKGDREKCLDAGCSDYLTKPIDLNGLVRAMAELAGTEIALVSEDEDENLPANENLPAEDSVEPESIESDSESQFELSFSESDLPQNKTIRKFTYNFIDTLERRRCEFESSLAERDKDQLASLAHWLKGTSGTVMLSQLAASAKEMEEAVRAEDWDTVEVLYGLVEAYTDRAIIFKREMPVG